jgi:hypothetical protein
MLLPPLLLLLDVDTLGTKIPQVMAAAASAVWNP